IAGMIAAAGPIIIHLLNRRRFRVVNWAAMDFLREALQRNRKILQMRDLILLLLRVLCVLLVGMALARPFFKTTTSENLFQQIWPWLVGSVALGLAIWAVLTSVRITKIAMAIGSLVLLGFAGLGFYDLFTNRFAAGDEAKSGRHPVHAVLILDNSLSMGYETLEGSLLKKAKAKAAEFIDQLPSESYISVIPLCGSRNAFSLDAYRSKDDALDALDNIEVVHRRSTAALAIQLAKEACKQVPELPSKRVVFLGDQQVSNWPSESLNSELANLPELQIVKVSAEAPENVWVSDFEIQDGIADIETPSTFLATIKCTGRASLKDVQIELTVDGTSVWTDTVDLEPGQSRLVEYKYEVTVPAEPGRPQFVNATFGVQTANNEGDHLKSDNKRHLVFPVVAGLPVVFIDQLGSREDVKAGEIGETYPLRRYLAPRLSREEYQRQLIQIRHITIEELDQQTLEDARLVVIGGVQTPGDSVPLLREYVQQGGQLVITAGGDFDPGLWTEKAWKEGAGILPVPLSPDSFGATPEELELAGHLEDLKVFNLDFGTMQHPYFILENSKPDDLASWYRLTLFFKAVQAEHSDDIEKALLAHETKRLTEKREFLESYARQKTEWEGKQKLGTFDPEDEATQAKADGQLRRWEPQWLLWQHERVDDRQSKPVELLAKETLPEILARYDVP
ncbi:MAG: BatA domain-containing protein, partial [Planctomycetaceae bacterium]|nr:BatA domain-containing protein [Planctomycetaceae bacterium]